MTHPSFDSFLPFLVFLIVKLTIRGHLKQVQRFYKPYFFLRIRDMATFYVLPKKEAGVYENVRFHFSGETRVTVIGGLSYFKVSTEVRNN